jgi:hypothetical protein
MGNPHSSDRVWSTPVRALRAVFAGFGRILLVADRPPDHTPGLGREGGAGGNESQTEQRGSAQSRWRPLDQTGNVRLLTAEDEQDDSPLLKPVTDPAPAEPDLDQLGRVPLRTASDLPDADADFVTLVTEPPEPAENVSPESVPAVLAPPVTLPVPDFDALSLASIRARLRNLSPDQLRVLADYERSHGQRPDVVGMLERRIEKLQANG